MWEGHHLISQQSCGDRKQFEEKVRKGRDVPLSSGAKERVIRLCGEFSYATYAAEARIREKGWGPASLFQLTEENGFQVTRSIKVSGVLTFSGFAFSLTSLALWTSLYIQKCLGEYFPNISSSGQWQDGFIGIKLETINWA